QVEGVDARDGHAKGIADEIANMVILEKGRIFREQRAFVWFFDVGFERHQSVFAGLVQQVVHHFQRIDVGLLAKFGAAEYPGDARRDFLDNVKRIGYEYRSDRSTANDNQFCRLDEHADVAVFHQISSDDATEDNDDANDREHS